MIPILIDISLIIILFFGNIFIENANNYFLLIYIFIVFVHIYALYFITYNISKNFYEIKNFFISSIFLYFITYFLICDPNPFLAVIFYNIFYPNFIKAIIIIYVHTYFISFSLIQREKIHFNLFEGFPFRYGFKGILYGLIHSYFLSELYRFLKTNKLLRLSFFFFIIIFIFDILIFENRIRLWVHLNKKDKTLPIAYSKNIIFYIAANIVNMEFIIENYINEMKKLIDYLGKNNVIISIVENGDSIDNTRNYLKDFQKYLNNNKILNKFILTKEIKDIRKRKKPFIRSSRLRIEFYAKLRNKCFDFIYELKNIDYDNVIIIFFNDVIFKYEDIINLLSTNNENYDSACALDIKSHYFYDRWVTIDLDGNGLKKYFPFFINKEAQDLILNHKPIRVFSCWNGVIAFKASPLKDKKIKFRHKVNYTLPKYLLNNPNKDYFESECTYFNIDLFSLGYDMKLINPDVRVIYMNENDSNINNIITYLKHISYSFILYFMGFCRSRNKLMSNYENQNIKLNYILKNWYFENKIDDN